MNNPVFRPDGGDLWMLDDQPINASLLRTAPYTPPALPPARGIMREGRIGRRYSDADTVSAPPALTVLDRHPLQGRVAVKFPDYRLETCITLRHDERILRFQTRYIPSGRRFRLGMTFPTTIGKGRIRHSVPCGHIVRPEGEFAAQGWIDYADRRKGLLLLNRGLPGNSVTGRVMMLSLFRAVAMEDADPVPWYEEGVEQVFEYALMPFNPRDPDYNPARMASLYNREIERLDIDVPIPKRSGVDAPAFTAFLSLEGDSAEVSCVRRERGALVVRLWETAGKRGTVVLNFRDPFQRCWKTNAAMTVFRPIPCADGRIPVSLKPFEIVTLKCLV